MMKTLTSAPRASLCIQDRSKPYGSSLTATLSHVCLHPSGCRAALLGKGESLATPSNLMRSAYTIMGHTSVNGPHVTHKKSWLHAGRLLGSRTSPSPSRPSTVTHAQGRRRSVDDDVDLDDEEYFDDAQARASGTP